MDLTRRPSGKWIVDFGNTMSEAEAALYEAPFGYVIGRVKPFRQGNREKESREFWFRHWRPRPEMWRALDGLSRYIATPRVAKHRLFVWSDARVCPDSALIAIARDDNTTFGILHSRFHEVWALRLGTSLEDRPRYTPSTTFETFPFPAGLTPDVPAADYVGDPRASAIAEAARKLVEYRDSWLNPPEWVEWVDELVPRLPQTSGSPQRGCRQGTQEAHPHEPLQYPPALARKRPRRSRRRRRRRLRLAGRHHRRRCPTRTAGAQQRRLSCGFRMRILTDWQKKTTSTLDS